MGIYDKEKKEVTLFGWIVILFAVIIGLLAFSVFTSKSDDENNATEENKYILVSDYSTYFTVENCVNRYVNAISNSNKKDVYSLLKDDYKALNGITEENALEKVGKLDSNALFEARDIYYKDITEETRNYYVYGKVKAERIGLITEGDNYYALVTVNQKDYTYKITPQTEESYKEAVK